MRILVTGGCGFLGHHIVQHLLKTTDAELVVLDKLTYASAGYDRLRDIGAYADPRVRVLGCDLAQPIPEGIARELGDVDHIIHTAAETHVDNSIADPTPFLASNVLGTHHLLWYARTLRGLRRMILVSTDEVYGPAAWDHPGNVPADPYRPANPYAATKAAAECLAWSYANTYGVPITIVNTMNLVGERQGAEKFVPLVIKKVLAGETVLIHTDPGKVRSGTRFYLHCRNFASALTFLLDIHPERTLKLHVAGEREIGNLELAQMIARFVGRPLHYELVDFHSKRPGHDLRYALDGSQIRGLGWQQPFTIDASLEKVVHWYMQPENRRWLDVGIGMAPEPSRYDTREAV